MDGPIPLILCFDVEPDEHVFAPEDPPPWRGFEALVDRASSLRRDLAALTGEPARFSWSLRMDPQIAVGYGAPAWAADRYRKELEEAIEAGDAVGVHPHAWRWEDGTWVADHGDPEWVDFCVRESFEAYASRFGAAPSHHRFGARFVSSRMLATVEDLGGRFDLTLEPGEPGQAPGELLGGRLTGGIPDQATVPRFPYHPSRADFRVPAPDGTSRLWAIPLSSGQFVGRRRIARTTLQRAAHPVRTGRGAVRRLRARARRSPGPAHRTLAPWLDWRTPVDFWDSAFGSLEDLPSPYLAFAIRSDLPLRRQQRERFDRIMASLRERPEGQRVVVTTPEDAVRRLGLEA